MKQIIDELEKEVKKCQHCGGELTQAPWNTRVDILLCMNGNCVAYRRPAGHVAIEESFENFLNKMYSQASDLEERKRGKNLWRP